MTCCCSFIPEYFFIVLSMLEQLGKASWELHQQLVVKQSGFLCCWSFDDYMTDGESHALKASRAFAHAAGIATNEDLKALASRAAQHSSTAHQLSAIASKEM
jgi:hypothetical protein